MQYKIPLFNLNYDSNEVEAVINTINSKWISMGPKCEELENTFAQMLNTNYAIAVASCTSALHLACYALNIGSGDEVICPSYTFAATVNAIKYVGAKPVFCDIKSKEDINIDADKVESLITNKTKAIIVMHFAGFPCNMDKIMGIAKKYNLYVIEDACHGPLSEYKGKKLGTIGDIGCFSFFSNKNISTGEGGMIITNNKALNDRIRLLRSHGMTTMSYQRSTGHATSYDIEEVGFNYRMDDIRASLGISQLKKLKKDLEQRQKIRTLYLNELKDINNITIPFKDNSEFVSNYIMPVVLNDSNAQRRDKIRNIMHEAGIQTSVHYPAVHRFSAYADISCDLPVTEYVTDNEFTLPMYSSLSKEQINYICKTLREAVK